MNAFGNAAKALSRARSRYCNYEVCKAAAGELIVAWIKRRAGSGWCIREWSQSMVL